jgi:hypothetical protein
VDVSIKVLDENVNLTRIKKYFSKEAWNHLKDTISTKKENVVYDNTSRFFSAQDVVQYILDGTS